MKILVAGGLGFIGSYLVEDLYGKGYKITVFDAESSDKKIDGVHYIQGDICDREKLREALKGVEIVYHLAGEASIERAIENPENTVRANILGTTILLEECVKAKIKRFVFGSTVYVYSRSGGFYRSTKKACEQIIRDFNDYYGLEYTILRFGTVYGPKDNIGNSIYRYITQAVQEGKITYHGDGSEVRQLIHVIDVARLCEEILDQKYANQSIIITGQDSLKMTDVFTMIGEMLGKNIKVEYQSTQGDRRDTHYNITPYSYDVDHGKKLTTNYYIDLGQGLLECVKCLKENNSGERIDSYHSSSLETPDHKGL